MVNMYQIVTPYSFDSFLNFWSHKICWYFGVSLKNKRLNWPKREDYSSERIQDVFYKSPPHQPYLFTVSKLEEMTPLEEVWLQRWNHRQKHPNSEDLYNHLEEVKTLGKCWTMCMEQKLRWEFYYRKTCISFIVMKFLTHPHIIFASTFRQLMVI